VRCDISFLFGYMQNSSETLMIAFHSDILPQAEP
jgi:hypothetical protein